MTMRFIGVVSGMGGGLSLNGLKSVDHGASWTSFSDAFASNVSMLTGIAAGGPSNAYVVAVGTTPSGGGISLRTRDSDDWTSGTATAIPMRSVAGGGNEKLIATTDNATTIYTSSNGLTWASQTVTTAGSGRVWNVIGSEWGSGEYAMMNDNGTKSAYSNDAGLTWTYATQAFSLTYGAFASPRMISTSTGLAFAHSVGVLTQTAPNVWTNKAVGTSYIINSLAAYGAVRVCVGAGSGNVATNKIYVSTDSGVNYTQVTLDHSAVWVKVDFDGTNFVMVGNDGTILYDLNQDGSMWEFATGASLTANGWQLIAFDTVKLTPVGSNSISVTPTVLKKMKISSGSLLNAVTTLTKFARRAASSLITGNTPSLSGRQAISMRSLLTSVPSLAQISKRFWARPWSMIYEFSKWIGVKCGAGYGTSSTDGVTWTKRSLPSSRLWNSIASNGTVIIALAKLSDQASTSTDGINWLARTLPESRSWSSIASDGVSRFVALSLRSDSCYTTEDGITWTERTLPQYANWTSVSYGDGKFVAVSDSNVAAYSTDGITWTQTVMPDDIQYNCVTWHLDQFTAVASGPTDLAATSADGITWTRIIMPAIANWTSVGPGVGDPNE